MDHFYLKQVNKNKLATIMMFKNISNLASNKSEQQKDSFDYLTHKFNNISHNCYANIVNKSDKKSHLIISSNSFDDKKLSLNLSVFNLVTSGTENPNRSTIQIYQCCPENETNKEYKLKYLKQETLRKNTRKTEITNVNLHKEYIFQEKYYLIVAIKIQQSIKKKFPTKIKNYDHLNKLKMNYSSYMMISNILAIQIVGATS